jgi:CDP-glycerol glycerophosphotransferase (TagB/SpsB family)
MKLNRYISPNIHKQSELTYKALDIIELFVSLFDSFYPKDDRTIIFGSNAGEYASGSPKALYEYVKKAHPNYKIYFYKPFDRSSSKLKKIAYILKFVPIFFRAKVLVSSHPPSDFVPFTIWSDRKIFINVWHGTPLKSMCFEDPSETESSLKRITKLNVKTSFFIVSSELEKKLILRCFRIDSEKICILGHPRNDDLLSDRATRTIHRILNINYSVKTTILYSPTYRRSVPLRHFPFKDFDWVDFDDFLEKNEIIILIRSHVYSNIEKVYPSKRVVYFGFDIYDDINAILPEIDILITDYSSIYIDYLLLNRPLIFLPYDLDTYKQERGLLFNDYDSITPGEKAFTYMQFKNIIKDTLSGNDPYKFKRMALSKQFHQVEYGSSCKNVFKLIEKG